MVEAVLSYVRLGLAIVARAVQVLLNFSRLYVTTAAELSNQLSIWLSLTLAAVQMVTGARSREISIPETAI